jgi:hypothetical protein
VNLFKTYKVRFFFIFYCCSSFVIVFDFVLGFFFGSKLYLFFCNRLIVIVGFRNEIGIRYSFVSILQQQQYS